MRAPLISLAVFLAACAGAPRKDAAPAIRPDALEAGKLEVRTVEDGEAKRVPMVVGVLAFRNNGPDRSRDATGTTLADLVSTELAKTRRLKVVERQRLDELEKELLRGDVGPVDQATAMRIGGMIGANVMAFGGFQEFGKKVVLNMRLVKVETGEVIGGVTERADDAGKLDLLAEAAARRTAEAVGGAR